MMGSSMPSPRPPILGLFSVCCPSAILCAVVAIVINSVNGVFRRGWFSHVFQEVFKTVQPTAADGDAASPVPLVGVIPWIAAPLLHLHPAEVCLCASHTVGAHLPTNRVSAKTSAASRLTRYKVGWHHESFSTTIAPTQPSLLSVFVTVWRLVYRCQSPVALSCQNWQFPHGWLLYPSICKPGSL